MTSKEYIRNAVAEYPRIRKELELLRKQIDDYVGITENEAISALIFRKSDQPMVDNSNISDKTANVSLMFRDFVKRMNEQSVAEMTVEYYERKHFLDWFDCQVGMIKEELKRSVFQEILTGLTYNKIAKKYYICTREVCRYKKEIKERMEKALERDYPEMLTKNS